MIIIIQRKYFITIANAIIHTANTDLIDNTELYKSYLFFLNLKAIVSNTKSHINIFPLENNVMYKTLDEKICQISFNHLVENPPFHQYHPKCFRQLKSK